MVKVYIVSGFLGSGKTTFIQKILSEKKFEKVMLLENEFGEVGVDSAFFDKSLKVKEINNGCICCSLQGDFKDALEEIEDMGVTDLIIEPSGVGKLSEIIDVVREDPDFKIVSHICIVDVKTCKKYHTNFKDYFDDQVKAANAIILSHLDVADVATINTAMGLVKELNPKADVTIDPIDKFSIEQLLDIIVSGGEVLPEIEEHDHDHEHEHDHEHHHHHHDHDHEHEHHHHDGDDDDEDEDEDFRSVAIRPTYVFRKEEIEGILANMPEDIIRVKGYVKTEQGTLYFNYVLNEYHTYYGEDRDDTLIVVIAPTLDKKAMRELFHE